MKREAELKSLFKRELKRQLPHFITLSYASAGAPDMEVVGNGVTSRWEGKHATPDFVSLGNQELCCMRLATQGHCRYIVWQSLSGDRTLIVHPNAIHARRGWQLEAEARCLGFDMGWLVEHVKGVHRA